ncbi:MAG: AAA family ATPase [Chloroflexota bacterium]|nr:AAA family ATPase [Chloroflexota bacterium]
MYTKRIQLVNYGPLENLDIELPFEGETPKPVILVGENGSGKSILLSHIVNGLIAAKGVAFPKSPEVEPGQVYKLRSSSYIKPGGEYFFARVDYDSSFYTSEIRTWRSKQEYPEVPTGISGTAAQTLWEKIGSDDNDHYDSNLVKDRNTTKRVEEIFAKNCVLYFPFNRFEEPAWLNEKNLRAQAQYMDASHIAGHTSRKVIASSPLHQNQNWLFEVVYDRAALELQIQNFPVNSGNNTILLPLFSGYSGDAARTYEAALQIVRILLRRHDVRFGIGKRHNRVVSIMADMDSEAKQLVPNIFQMSSGETSLLNLFLSILRDFDLCHTPFTSTSDIRGIVVVDEIDLHLHAVHQHDVLPELVKLFPKVQFVVATHSPLFVLGMQRVFGEDGFALYRLPEGQRISPEEFSEFGDAYQAFTKTARFSNAMRAAIEEAQKPIVFVEGTTDQRYIHQASQLLGKEAILQRFEIRNGGGKGNLDKIWKLRNLPDSIVRKGVVLLYDCDTGISLQENGNFVKQAIPRQDDHPIKKGIENLLSKETLEKARQHKPAFIDVDPGRTKTVRGKDQIVPDEWSINEDEKKNLCDWLCEHGAEEDFQQFLVIFELLENMLDLQPVQVEEVAAGELRLDDTESFEESAL